MEHLTKCGERPLTADELSMLGDKAFAMKLEDHGGRAVYALSSAMIEGKDPNLDFIRQALAQLEKASLDPKIGDGDKIEIRNIAAELKARFPQIGETMMTEAQMASWVRKNCKFAAKKTAGILDYMKGKVDFSTIRTPHAAFQALQNAYKERAQQMGMPTTAQEIKMDLQQVDQMLGLSPEAGLNNEDNIGRLMRSVAPAPQAAPVAAPQAAPAPAPAPEGKPNMSSGTPGSRFQPDPVEQFMAQKRKQKTV